MTPPTTPESLRAALARSGLTQVKTADLLGISRRQFRRYVREGATVPPWLGLAVMGLEISKLPSAPARKRRLTPLVE